VSLKAGLFFNPGKYWEEVTARLLLLLLPLHILLLPLLLEREGTIIEEVYCCGLGLVSILIALIIITV
jgi:hypothetical protein